MIHPRLLLKAFLVSVMLLLPAVGQEQETPDDKKNQPRLRMICVSSLQQDHEVKIAARDEKGEWLELGKTGIRASFVSDWLPAKTGELHLTVPGTDGPQSICKFAYPEGTRRALIVLIADPAKKTYRAAVYDPEKLDFAKGSVLVVNFSSRPGMVAFGTKKVTVEPGGRSVVKPTPEQNGMYRMLVAYENEDKKPVACYDRYVQGNPESRDLMFLIPDPILGLKAFSLPIFGSFD